MDVSTAVSFTHLNFFITIKKLFLHFSAYMKYQYGPFDPSVSLG